MTFQLSLLLTFDDSIGDNELSSIIQANSANNALLREIFPAFLLSSIATHDQKSLERFQRVIPADPTTDQNKQRAVDILRLAAMERMENG